MGYKTEVTYFCDLTEEKKHSAVDTIETVTFSWSDGRPREADLCGMHREAFDMTLAPLVAVSRRTGSPPMSAPRRSRTPSTSADKEQRQAIREWARARGHEIGDKGRISEAIVAEYNAAAQ